MTKKEITSRPGWFGTTVHYDSNGRKVGESRPGFFGTTNHYDTKGRRVGSSTPGLFGGTNHRDASGRPVGSSRSSLFGTTNHYDKNYIENNDYIDLAKRYIQEYYDKFEEELYNIFASIEEM